MSTGSADAASAANALERHLGNPFLVLELPPGAPRVAAERQGAKLLGLLATGAAGAEVYPTHLGPRPRTPEAVRAALAELRDPDRRLAAEWWARGFLEAAGEGGAGEP